MATLLLRLAAPLQSWGADSKFETRKTNREPTKSGVIGLLAAALGLRRDQNDEIAKLARLRFGVRVDREGQLLIDFHTAKMLVGNKSYITYRHYLQDAAFLVGLESDDMELLRTLEDAITHPEYPLFLGRRSCPPTLPICIGIKDMDLTTSLEQEPKLCSNSGRADMHRIIVEADSTEGGRGVQQDVPISFNPGHRQYGYRSVKEYMINLKKTMPAVTDHDPFYEL